MRLYLVQHGAALGKDVDPRRPLSEQGEQDVRAMAKVLGAAGVHVGRVWHSGKRRAEQTAVVLAQQLLQKGQIEETSGINPNDSVQGFASDADCWEEDTLVVGHLPFMSRLVALLIVGDPEGKIVSYHPGSVVCLERSAAEEWTLQWMVRPDMLVTPDH